MLTTLAACLLTASTAFDSPPRHISTVYLPTYSEGFHHWPANEISGIEFLPHHNELLILPDDRSKQAPARIGMVRLTIYSNSITRELDVTMGPIRWTALRDERGETFARNTVDPEAVRLLHLISNATGGTARIVWVSEGHAKSGVQPAVYEMNLDGSSPTKWKLPDAFLQDQPDSPTHGIRHNRGFESLAVDNWAPSQTVYAAVERPLIQDEPEPVCRVLVRTKNGPSRQIGYPLGPAPEQTDPASASLAELLSVGPGRLLALENAEREDGRIVSTLWWCSSEVATDINGVESLADPGEAETRLIEKQLLIDFSTLPGGEGLGDFEAMTLISRPEGRDLLLVAEDNGGVGETRMLIFELPRGLQK